MRTMLGGTLALGGTRIAKVAKASVFCSLTVIAFLGCTSKVLRGVSGNSELKKGDYEAAAAKYWAAWEQCEAERKALGDEKADRCIALNALNHGETLLIVGKPGTAERSCRKASRAAGQHGWKRLTMLANTCTARALAWQGRVDEAIDVIPTQYSDPDHIAKMLAADPRRLGVDDRVLAVDIAAHIAWIMGRDAEQRGDLKAAEEAYRRASELSQTVCQLWELCNLADDPEFREEERKVFELGQKNLERAPLILK